jgi:NAD(P)-dependent dehydrogenase (short-subunit alcohol dehydrogenase family)
VAVVTGGASGIGRAAARLLARHGARVFVGDGDFLPEHEREFAAAVHCLAGDAYLVVTGTLIAIDGGKSLGMPPR